jgi:hypothetical protein
MGHLKERTMHHMSKLIYAALSASLLVAAASVPSQAQGSNWKDPNWTWQHGYFPYQNPDGTYNSAADYSRDSWGVPCGINCTRSARERWQRYYTPNPVPPGP